MTKRISLSVLLVAASLQAYEFQPLGFKATAMGGTGVASAPGSLAGYYNPALLGLDRNSIDISIGGAVQVRDNGLLPKVQKLSDDGFIDAIDNVADSFESFTIVAGVSEEDEEAILSGIETIKTMDGQSIQLQPNLFFGAQIMGFGIGLYALTEATVIPNINNDYDELIFKVDDSYVGSHLYGEYNPTTNYFTPSTQEAYESSSIQYGVEEGEHELEIMSLAVLQIHISYGHNFAIPTGSLSVGGSLKLMKGYTYNKTYTIDDEDIAMTMEDIQDDATESSAVGIDAGVIYSPDAVESLRVGLVLKNVNAPTFEAENGEKKVDININPMARLGLSYMLLDSLEVAADMDLNENETLDSKVKSRMIGVGLGWHPVSWFNLSGGLMQNSSNSSDGTIYTGGIGLGPLDIAAQVSSNTNTYEGESVPSYINLMASLSIGW